MHALFIGVLMILLLLLVFLSLVTGRFAIPPSELKAILLSKMFGQNEVFRSAAWTVLSRVRLPRITAAVFVGAALSVAGSAYQGIFKNPMVSPDLLGASAGSGFGAALALLLGASLNTTQFVAFLGGLGAVLLTYAISRSVSKYRESMLTIVLTGVIISSLFNALISLIKYLADPNSKLPEITFWLMGGLASVTLQNLPTLIVPVVLGLLPALSLRYRLNVLTLSEDEARAMGVDTRQLRKVFVVCATLVTSASVAVSGMIGWVGLVIPHFARMLVGSDYSRQLPTAMLLGSIYLLLIDNLSRWFFTVEVPLSVLTSLVGAPFFIYLLKRDRKGGL